MRHDILNPVDDCICFNCPVHRKSIWKREGPDCGCESMPFYAEEMCSQCRYRTKCEIALNPYTYSLTEDGEYYNIIKDDNNFWKNKVEEVVRISQEYGYEEFDKEFWWKISAVLCSLVIDIYKSKEKEPK